MKKIYLIPAMEYFDIQTSTICNGSGNEDNPLEDPPTPTGGVMAPRHM